MFVVVAQLFLHAGTASAQTASTNGTTITGTVIDLATSLPINNALITLYHNDARVSEVRTSNDGVFTFDHQPPGVYFVEVRDTGYTAGRSTDVFTTPNDTRANLTVTLQRASESNSSGLKQIGRVSAATANSSTLQTSSSITQEISPDRLQQQNYARIADALGTLPGVNLRGLDSAIGDDIYVDIRGFKATETTTLLDGHPIGPLGVFGSAGGSNSNQAYNYIVSPFFALRNIETTFGAGALNTLYGSDGVGGTVDLQTLLPTQELAAHLKQGFGNQGKLTTAVDFSGTVLNNKLGFVVSHGVQGTYGEFQPGAVYHPSNFPVPLQDFSASAIAAATYPVSGNYLLRQDLAKLRFAFSPYTNLTTTFYLGSSYDDKTGNGDNDSYFNGVTLANINANIAAALAAGSPSPYASYTDPTTMQVVFNCPATQAAVKLNSGFACESLQTFAQQNAGPNVQAPNKYQNVLNQDFHAKLNTQYGQNNLSFDTFIDRMQTNTKRGGVDSNFNTSFGFLASDDIVNARNDFGFGYSTIQQRLDGDSIDTSGVRTRKPVLGQGFSNYYVRDIWNATPKLTLFGNLFLKNTTTIPNENRLDPRLTIAYKASPSDVFRLSGARTQGVPSILLSQGAPSFSDPLSTTYVAPGQGLTIVGNAPATGIIRPEDSKELDLTYGHRFQGDSQIQIAVYNANVRNIIIQGATAIANLPALLTNPQFLNNFNQPGTGYAARAGSTNFNDFGVNTVFNASSFKAQGIELSGRYRYNPRLFFDYTFDEQQAITNGYAVQQLMENHQLVNGGQAVGVPRQKASLAIDANDGHGLELRVDTFYTGNNNALNGPPYTQLNASLTKGFSSGLTLNFGVQNLTNTVAASAYGRFGDNVFVPENQFGTDKSSYDQAISGQSVSERFFLPSRAYQFTITQKI